MTHPSIVGPQPVVEAMALDGLEALEVQHALRELLAGGITIHHRMQICLARLQDSLFHNHRNLP